MALGLVGCASSSTSPAPTSHSERPTMQATLKPDPSLSRFEVEVCFPGGLPARIKAGVPEAARFLSRPAAHDDEGDVALTRNASGHLVFDRTGRPGCVRYDVDVHAVLVSHGGTHALRTAQALMISTDFWLWRPAETDASTTTELHIVAPSMTISTPWPASKTHPQRLALDATALHWRSHIALGAFETKVVDVLGARLEVALLDGKRAMTDDALLDWFQRAGGAVAAFFGEFPVRRLQVIAVPAGASQDPIVFGFVVRGGGPSVLFFLNSEATDADLTRDWVAVHEFFHLGMPPIYSRDAWLSEGVTMYYTEVLRARAGFISTDDAIERIHDGFGRGRASGTGATLAEESAKMQQTGAYFRVYWAGAAIALNADIAQRQATRDESLDTALQRLFRCCARDKEFWSAKDVVAKLDALATRPFFRTVAEQWVGSAAFPDVSPAYSALGLSELAGEPPTQSRGAAERSLRKALLGRRAR